MSVRTVIADDEAPARERLKRFLAGNDSVEVVGEAEDGIKAVELIQRESPDLVLLDIQMPGLDGFGVVEALENHPIIIFITAYDEYAIRAFEVNALDYLLKPFTRERLDAALERAGRELSGRGDFSARLDALFDTLKGQRCCMERLAVKQDEKILVIDTCDIDWIGAKKGPVHIHTAQASYPSKYTLDELENRLDPAVFFRTHRSAIVNLTRIKEIVPWFAGTFMVRLADGSEIELSRNQAKALKKIIKW